MTKPLEEIKDVAANLYKLPLMCASVNLSSGEPIIIRRGVQGYYPAPKGLDVAGFNSRHAVTEAQKLAMECGSMAGWDVPGANPENW